jgi:uncharacterized paraquat-inducible protein A
MMLSMAEHPFIIVPCPSCGVKNRVQNYDRGKVPVCAKCKARLLTDEEHEAQSKFKDSMENFMNLPGFGQRSDSKD